MPIIIGVWNNSDSLDIKTVVVYWPVDPNVSCTLHLFLNGQKFYRTRYGPTIPIINRDGLIGYKVFVLKYFQGYSYILCLSWTFEP